MRTTLALMLLVSFALAATGGPDGGGYYWFDQEENANFFSDNWIDISSTGTLISSGWIDDSYGLAGSYAEFLYYGSMESSLYVSENGAVVFEDDDPSYFEDDHSDHFPGEHEVNKMVAPLWGDWNIGASGEVYFQDFGDRFVIMWNEIDNYDDGTVYTFEMIGWERDGTTNSNIAFLYNSDTSSYTDYVIGMQVDDTTGTELMYKPDAADAVVGGDWYLLTQNQNFFDDYAVEEATWGQIKAM